MALPVAAPATVLTPVLKASEALRKAHTIFMLGTTGSGKSSQIVSLPGKKFAYIWEPNALETLRGYPNLDYLEFLPEDGELDLRLKGFNSDSKSDRPKSDQAGATEPKLFNRWLDDYSARRKSGFFLGYDWLITDSYTYMVAAMMERQMYLDKRNGEPPDKGDYRVVGDALRRIMLSQQAIGVNIFITGHLSIYKDEKTSVITTQANLPGQARTMIPLGCTNIWLAEHNGEASKNFTIRTKPDPRGLREIRTTIPNLKEIEDVTLTVDAKGRFTKPEQEGIGKLLAIKKTP